MGALTRPYGRRVRPLNPTLVPYLTAGFIPVILLSVLGVLALQLIPDVSSRILAFTPPGVVPTTSTISPEILSPENAGSLSVFSPEVRAWEEDILRWSNLHSLPPTLVAIVMQIESCGAPNVESSAGAMGLFQVMPFHFSSVEDPFDPEVNAARGLDYLARAHELAGGSIDKTLAGYNGGHSVINWDPNNWPEETIRYVKWGTGIWTDLQSGEMRSETLNQWLGAGGEHLCQKARE